MSVKNVMSGDRDVCFPVDFVSCVPISLPNKVLKDRDADLSLGDDPRGASLRVIS
jgi:hypothetical protein